MVFWHWDSEAAIHVQLFLLVHLFFMYAFSYREENLTGAIGSFHSCVPATDDDICRSHIDDEHNRTRTRLRMKD